MNKLIIIPGIIAAVSFQICCSHSTTTAKVDRRYDTVGQDPTRNTELARELNGQAVKLIEAGQFAEAEQILKQALESDVMHGPAHCNLGLSYYHRQEYYLAAWEFQYASNLMPFHAEPRNNLGLVLEAVGKLDEAVNQFDEALEMQPSNPELVANAARTRFRRGDRDLKLLGLLDQLVLADTRPQWRKWAAEQAVLIRSRNSHLDSNATSMPANLP